MVDPISALGQLVTDTVASVQGLVTLAGTPNFAPILIQFATNQITYAELLGGGVLSSATSLVSSYVSAIGVLPDIVNDLLSGNVGGAFILGAEIALLPFTAWAPAGTAIQTVLTMVTTHVLNLVNAIGPITGLVVNAIVGPPLAAYIGTANAIQNVVSALTGGDVLGALSAALAAPFIIADYAIKDTGIAIDGVPASGLLGQQGPIGALLQIRNLIATAIDGPVPAAPAAVNTTPKTAAKTVTLNVTPPTGLGTGTKLSTSTTPPAGGSTSLGTPGKTAGAGVKAVLAKTGDLGLKHQTAKTTKK